MRLVLGWIAAASDISQSFAAAIISGWRLFQKVGDWRESIQEGGTPKKIRFVPGHRAAFQLGPVCRRCIFLPGQHLPAASSVTITPTR